MCDRIEIKRLRDLKFRLSFLEMEERCTRNSKSQRKFGKKRKEKLEDLEWKIALLKSEIRCLEMTKEKKEREKIEREERERIEKEERERLEQEERERVERQEINSLRVSKEEVERSLTSARKRIENLENYLTREKRLKAVIKGGMDEDLVCTICTELYIRPVILDCTHTFCERCIMEWRSSLNVCPICRCEIRSAIRVRSIEQFLDKAVPPSLCPEQLRKRSALIAQRSRIRNPPVLPCEVCSFVHDLHSRRHAAAENWPPAIATSSQGAASSNYLSSYNSQRPAAVENEPHANSGSSQGAESSNYPSSYNSQQPAAVENEPTPSTSSFTSNSPSGNRQVSSINPPIIIYLSDSDDD